MKLFQYKLTILTIFAVVFSMAISISAQNRAYRVTDTQVKTVIDRIETRTDTFRKQFERYTDNRVFNTQVRDQLVSYVNDFEGSTDNLRNNFNSRNSSTDDVREVLNRGTVIDQFMRSNRVNTAAQTQWSLIRSDLNILAGYYRVTWDWNTSVNTSNNSTQISDSQMRTILSSLENKTDAFRRQIELYNNRSYSTQSRQELVSFVSDFENATDNLKSNYTSRRASADDVQQVLSRASSIDNFMRNNRVNTAAQGQWNQIRTDLNTLAGYYRVSWDWNNPLPTNNPNNPRGFDARLTGTYRLNTSQSDSVTTAIDRVLNNSTNNNNNQNDNNNRNDRARRNLERRLTPPNTLVIQKQGEQIMLASSLSQQVTFNADGVSRSEAMQNGRSMQTRVTATNTDLAIDYEGDRMNDFNVTFTPLNSNQLRVTRRVYLENRNETVTINSLYDKTDVIARWDGITMQSYPNDNSNNNYPNGTVNDTFLITNNTQLMATLDTPLSTKAYKDGDRFTMTVTSPSQYRGAIIQGRVNGQKSGVVSGRANLSLDFDTIAWNGTTYRFAGIVDRVRDTNGNTVSVNNEGQVRDNNQTTKTVTRAGIGAALGAIIGAIAGGGQGAVIGAGIGAGAGAGSVILQGRDNLELNSGTEFTVTATAPANR